jgi:transposase
MLEHHNEKRGFRNEYSYVGYRFGEERISDSRSGCEGQDDSSPQPSTLAAIAIHGAQLQPCLVGMAACGGAHYWAREIAQLGHEVKLMSPRFVHPYVKSNKNDARDAEAICEAVGRPSMRFVAVKSQTQQEVLALHRV